LKRQSRRARASSGVSHGLTLKRMT